MGSEKYQIKITRNGPYIVTGGVPLTRMRIEYDDEGYSAFYRTVETYDVPGTYALCRCGHSKTKPFCDGSHAGCGFDGTETAKRKGLMDRARVIKGPGIHLYDIEGLCAYARFCHSKKGDVWTLTERSGDALCKEEAIKEACNCPAGRLIAVDAWTGRILEPEYEPGISIIEDPAEGGDGPIWVKGGIPIIGENGTEYEPRNRVTLCRCGRSRNKPFCNGIHADR